MRALRVDPVEIRRVAKGDGVAFALRAQAPAIKNAQNHGPHHVTPRN
jgi:hypothetical protein